MKLRSFTHESDYQLEWENFGVRENYLRIPKQLVSGKRPLKNYVIRGDCDRE